MSHRTRSIELVVQHPDHVKRLKDPTAMGIYHLETWLPFGEAAKLERGNANVRPASGRRKPFRDMMDTIETDPMNFHLKNRGIIYRCEKFEYLATKRGLRLTIPEVAPESNGNGLGQRYGVADGGHTLEAIVQTMARLEELKELPDWREPYVRVHFLAGEAIQNDRLEELVEALNTSSQVQQYTLDEYRKEFEELKTALRASGFDTELVAWTENDEKEWNVREIIQRMACFLKDRWRNTQPTSMYKSKGKALELWAHEESRVEFRKLYPVIVDVLTLPELIESEFSIGDAVLASRRMGKLKAVRSLKKPHTRPGTIHATLHRMDLAASLPLAAAFRELLELRDGGYAWKVPPKEVLSHSADELYALLVQKSKTAKGVHTLGSDTEYWTQAVNIVLRAKDDLL